MIRSKSGALARVLRFTLVRWLAQPVALALTVGLMLATTAVDIALPVVTGRLVAAVADPAAHGGPWDDLAVLLLLAGLAVATKIGSILALIDLSLNAMRGLLQDGFARVQRLPAGWHADSFAGSTVRKITRGGWALDLMADTVLLGLGPSLIVLLGTALTLALFQPWLGVAALAISALFVGVSVLLSVRVVAPAASLSNAQDSRMSGAIADAITANAVVKAHAAETREDDRFSRVAAKWHARSRRTWRRGTWSGLAQDVILWALRALVLLGALVAWAQGAAGPGDVAFVVTALATMQGYLRQVGREVSDLQKAVNDMEELVALMELPPEADTVSAAGTTALAAPAIRPGAIAYDHVHYGYEGAASPLFTDLHVAIPSGQKVGLVGRSGSGKTTFVKLLQRMHGLTGGRILLDGRDIAAMPLGDLRRSLAVVAQDPILFHRSLADNIAYARPGAGLAAVRLAAERAGAAEFVDRLPKGYGTLVGERGIKLSGGERQRVAIARAFLSDAPVLVMDEATSSLDSESEAAVAEAAERLMEGRTTLVIAHRLATVARMHRLLVFDRGRIAEDGAPGELLLREGGIYRSLHERQAGAMAA